MTINISLSNLANLQNETTAISTINANSATIAGGFTTALNTTGDQMQGTLDMNSNEIINLPTPGTANSPLRLSDLVNFQGGGTVIFPTVVGGTNINVPATTNATYTVSTITGPIFTSVSTTTLSTGVATISTANISTANITTANVTTGKFTSLTVANNQSINFLNSGGSADGSMKETPSGTILFLTGSNQAFDITDHGQNPMMTVVGVTGTNVLSFQIISATSLAASQVSVLATATSASPTTGALVVSGGLGVAQSIYASTINATTANITTLTISSFTGPVTTASLNSGSNASNTTFWRGDATWTTPLASAYTSITTINLTTSSASISLSSVFTNQYSSYEVVFQNIIPASSSTWLELQYYTGTGYSATTYLGGAMTYNAANSFGANNTTAYLIVSSTIGTTAVPGVNGKFRIMSPGATTGYKSVVGEYIQPNNIGNFSQGTFGGWWTGATTAIPGFQLLFNTGNISSGSIQVYGVA